LPFAYERVTASSRTRVGVAGGLDYRGRSGARACVRLLFSNFQNYGDRWVYSPGAGDFLTPTVTDSNGTMDASLQNHRPNEQIFSVTGGARQSLGSLLIDYELTGSHARQNRLDQTSVNFANITTTSRYPASTPVRLARALARMEDAIRTPFAQTAETPKDPELEPSARSLN